VNGEIVSIRDYCNPTGAQWPKDLGLISTLPGWCEDGRQTGKMGRSLRKRDPAGATPIWVHTPTCGEGLPARVKASSNFQQSTLPELTPAELDPPGCSVNHTIAAAQF
jgi:hypothetical protein